MVVAHTEQHIVDVGTDRLAHCGDGVRERKFRGEKGVGGVLTRLGGRRIRDHDRCTTIDIERRHMGGRRLVVGTDHHPIGMEEIVDGAALTQELRVRHDRDVGAAERLLDQPG